MDSAKSMKLLIELVPSTVWYSSIYQYYQKSNNLQKWNEIKKELYQKEGDSCWICKAKVRPLEAHEFWSYDDKKHIQKLTAVHHLCDLCHKIKHIGLWFHSADGDKMLRQQKIRKEDIINHFCKVNNCSIDDFQKYEDSAFAQWKQRSAFQWKQDLGIYNLKFGFKKLKSQQKLVS